MNNHIHDTIDDLIKSFDDDVSDSNNVSSKLLFFLIKWYLVWVLYIV